MHRAHSTPKPAEPQWLSIAQAAERIGVARITIRRRIAAGDLTAYRAGSRLIRLDAGEVDGLLTLITTAGGAA